MTYQLGVGRSVSWGLCGCGWDPAHAHVLSHLHLRAATVLWTHPPQGARVVLVVLVCKSARYYL